MTSARSLAATFALTAALLAPPAAGHATDGGAARPSQSRAVTASPAPHDVLVPRAPVGGHFQGIDGLVYSSAPPVVPGLDGQLFYGPDFDVACGIGASSVTSMKSITKLARVIQRSGRRVIWTGAPSSATVLSDKLDPSQLPHGACDQLGLAQEDKALDNYAKTDPNYLPLRQILARDHRQVYWKTDPHWTSVGGAVFSREVAKRLDPKLAHEQHYTYGTETRVGELNQILGDDTPETLATADPDDQVSVRTDKDSVDAYSGLSDIVLDTSWTTSPARRTWPGQTLLLGDSMTLFALPTMRPIFRHGRFMWVEHVDIDDVVAAIKQADTVVIEVLQTFIPLGQTISSSSFRAKVRRALAR